MQMNMIKALEVVAAYVVAEGEPEVIITEAKSMNLYNTMFVLKGVRKGYRRTYVVNSERGTIFEPHPAVMLSDEQLCSAAILEWNGMQ